MPPTKHLNERELTELYRRYQAGERAIILAQDYNVCVETVYYTLQQAGIDRTKNFRNLAKEEIDLIPILYSNGMTHRQIASLLGVSRPAISAHYRLRDVNRQTRSQSQQRYNCNHRYFFDINDSAKAYWLGFLMADGSICAGNQVSLTLAAKDADHLKCFTSAIESNHPVHLYSYPNRHPSIEMCRLVVASDQMTSDLSRKGILPRKTFVADWPDIPALWDRDFLRGLIDGDGSFHSSRRHNLSLHLLGTKALMNKAQLRLVQNCQLQPVTLLPHPKSSGIVSFRDEGNRQLIRIVNYLYEGATIYLPRKRDIVLNHYRSLPKYRDQLRFG